MLFLIAEGHIPMPHRKPISPKPAARFAVERLALAQQWFLRRAALESASSPATSIRLWNTVAKALHPQQRLAPSSPMPDLQWLRRKES
jgi:hypothetical protein